jgi:hypothetical protein
VVLCQCLEDSFNQTEEIEKIIKRHCANVTGPTPMVYLDFECDNGGEGGCTQGVERPGDDEVQEEAEEVARGEGERESALHRHERDTWFDELRGRGKSASVHRRTK